MKQDNNKINLQKIKQIVKKYNPVAVGRVSKHTSKMIKIYNKHNGQIPNRNPA